MNKLEKMGYKVSILSIYDENPYVEISKHQDGVDIEFCCFINRNQITQTYNANEKGLEELKDMTIDEHATEFADDYYNDMRLLVKSFILKNCHKAFSITRFKVGEEI